MQKFAWLSSFMIILLMGFSMILATPIAVSAIGEVTPTPMPEEPADVPDDVDVEELIGEALTDLQNGDFLGALSKMDIAILADPNVPTAYLIRGVANSQLDLIDEALADFTSAIELAPWQFDTYIFRGDTYFADEDYENAVSDYTQAIRVNPINVEGFVRRSSAYYELGDDTAGDLDDLIARSVNAFGSDDTLSAFAFLDEAIEVGEDLPAVANAYYIRAILNMQLGENDAALDDYNSASEANPDFHHVYLARGILYREDGDIVAAGEDFYTRITTWGTETLDESMDIGDTIEVEMAYRRVYEITFEGEAGQVITISADDFGGAVVDPLIALLDPDGDPIAGDDDFGGALNSQIEEFELPDDGTYTLLLSHAEGGVAFGFNGIVEIEIEEE